MNNKSNKNKRDIMTINDDIKSPLPSDLITKFLENQTKEIELRAKELELDKQKDENTFTYAKSALNMKVEDRKEQMNHFQIVRKMTFNFILILSALIIGLMLYSLHLDKDQIVMEIIKSILFFLTGGAGGYAIGKNTEKKSNKMSKK
ncbi:DUF2335 domain-containing protein [Candidatus Magnetomoraceae bacterium gMMP-15]